MVKLEFEFLSEDRVAVRLGGREIVARKTTTSYTFFEADYSELPEDSPGRIFLEVLALDVASKMMTLGETFKDSELWEPLDEMMAESFYNEVDNI